MIGAVEGAALGDGVFEEHCSEGGERRAAVLRIVGCDDSGTVVCRVREEHLVDVAVVKEECELVFQLEAVVETAADCEETAGRLEISDAAFYTRRQEGIWKERQESMGADGEENVIDLQAGFV